VFPKNIFAFIGVQFVYLGWKVEVIPNKDKLETKIGQSISIICQIILDQNDNRDFLLPFIKWVKNGVDVSIEKIPHRYTFNS
jgi:hypothetical protein